MSSLNSLPVPVLQVLCSVLNQCDAVNLAIACPAARHVALQSVYHTVVIDPKPHSLHTQLASTSTYVHTAHGMRQFFKAVQTTDYGAYVRSLSCRGILPINDSELEEKLGNVVPKLSNLVEFEWTASPEFPLYILAELPQTVCSLVVDLASRTERQLPQFTLPNLYRLHVRPFLDASILNWLASVCHDCHNLKDVSLSRFLDMKEHVGSGYVFRGSSDVSNTYTHASLASFFASFEKDPLKLQKLALCQADLRDEDCRVLAKCIDLPTLKMLELIGTGTEHCCSFINDLAEAQPALTHFKLDYRAATPDAVTKLFTPALRSLNLRVYTEASPLLASLATRSPDLTALHISAHEAGLEHNLEHIKSLNALVVLTLPYDVASKSWLLAKQLPKLKVLRLESTAKSTSPGGLLTNGLLDQWNNHIGSPLQYQSIVASLSDVKLDYLSVGGTLMTINHQAPPLEWYDYMYN